MYMNGAAIGMEITAVARRPILRDLIRALSACTVVAVGSTTRGTAECRIVAEATQTTGTTTWGCALPYRIDREDRYYIYNLLRGSEKSVGLGEGVGFADVDEVEVVAAESFDANRAGLGYVDIAGL